MATYDVVVSAQMPAAPHVVFAAWMSSEGHSQMTGAPAEVEHSSVAPIARGTALSRAPRWLSMRPSAWCSRGGRSTSTMSTRIR